jgi:hypothetical protein
MNFQTNSGRNKALIQHAIIFDVFEAEDGVNVSFISGEGEIIDEEGDHSDPMCFSIQFFPSDEYFLVLFMDTLKFWSERNDPIDLSIINDKTIIHNSVLNCSIEIYLD